MSEITQSIINEITNTVEKETQEKKHRRSHFEIEIEETEKELAKAIDEDDKKHLEEHLSYLRRKQSKKAEEFKSKKAIWALERHIKSMSSERLTCIFNRYLEEMKKRNLLAD